MYEVLLPAITTRPDISPTGPHSFFIWSDSGWIQFGSPALRTESVRDRTATQKEPWPPKPTVNSGIALSSLLAMTAARRPMRSTPGLGSAPEERATSAAPRGLAVMENIPAVVAKTTDIPAVIIARLRNVGVYRARLQQTTTTIPMAASVIGETPGLRQLDEGASHAVIPTQGIAAMAMAMEMVSRRHLSRLHQPPRPVSAPARLHDIRSLILWMWPRLLPKMSKSLYKTLDQMCCIPSVDPILKVGQHRRSASRLSSRSEYSHRCPRAPP